MKRDEPPILPSPRVRAEELELISMVGHELRNPLTVIRGAATLLLQAQSQMPLERRQAMLRLIEQHSEAMSDLVEDLMPTANRLGCEAELADVGRILAVGASYQRQRAVAAAHGGDLRLVRSGQDGSVFEATLPVRSVNEDASSA